MFKHILLTFLLAGQTALADTKPLSSLPLATAGSRAGNDALIFVDSQAGNTTKRLNLLDLHLLTNFANPTFTTGKVLTGFSASGGTVTAADSILTAINKLAAGSTPSAPISIGNLDSQTVNAKGLDLTGNVLAAQSADATHPGLVNTSSQSFGGTKTFANIIDSGLTASTVPYANASKQLTSSSVTPTELGYLSGVSSAIQTQIGNLAPKDSPSFTTLTNFAYGTASTVPYWDASKNLVPSAVTPTELGYVSGATSNLQTQINSVSSAAISVGAFDGQAVDAKGMVLTSNVLYAQSADATHPGMINTGAQTFAGAKTFSSTIVGSVNGNAGTATALAANPSDCASDTYATTIAASGNLTCSSVSDAGLAVSYLKADGSRGLSSDWNAGAHNITATTFIGAVTGNASTATALAANPSDCSSGQFATTIAASGNLTCAAIANTDLPAPTTSTISASDIDWSTLKNKDALYTKTLGANTTLTWSNVTAGQTIVIALTNTASNYTVTWPAAAKWPAGTAPTQTVGAKTDVITCKAYDSTNAYCSSVQNY